MKTLIEFCRRHAGLLALAALALAGAAFIALAEPLGAAPVLLMQAPMSAAQARVVDPILSTVARGYRNHAHIWPHLFPAVEVAQRGGKIIEFGDEAFRERALARAPGGERKRIQVGYQGKDYAVQQHAADGVLPVEIMQEARAVPGIDLGRYTVSTTLASLSLQTEILAGKLVAEDGNFPAANITALAGDNQWSSANSGPAEAVEGKKADVKKKIGVNPNTLVVGEQVHRALVNHPDVIDRIKHVTGLGRDMQAMVSHSALAAYFRVDSYIVGEATYKEEADGDFKDVWGNVALLAYVARSSLAQAEAAMGEPSFGYTYRLRGYPEVRAPRFDEGCDSWLYPVTLQETPVIAGNVAAVKFKSVVA